MVKKILLSAGALISAFAATVGLVMAQTPTPTDTPTPMPSATVSPTGTASPSPTASPTTRVPSGAPATGMGGY